MKKNNRKILKSDKVTRKKTEKKQTTNRIIKIGFITISIIVVIGMGICLEKKHGTISKIKNNFSIRSLNTTKTISTKSKKKNIHIQQSIKQTESYIAQTVSVKSFVRHLPAGQKASSNKILQAQNLSINLETGTTIVDAYESIRYTKIQNA